MGLSVQSDASRTWRALYAKGWAAIMRERQNYVPGAAGQQKGVSAEIGGNRDIMRVVGRVVPMPMVGIAFSGQAIVMAVFFVRQGGMAFDFGKGESGSIM